MREKKKDINAFRTIWSSTGTISNQKPQTFLEKKRKRLFKWFVLILVLRLQSQSEVHYEWILIGTWKFYFENSLSDEINVQKVFVNCEEKKEQKNKVSFTDPAHTYILNECSTDEKENIKILKEDEFLNTNHEKNTLWEEKINNIDKLYKARKRIGS